MDSGDLLSRCRLGHFPYARNIPAFIRVRRKPNARASGHHVKHPAVGHTDADRSKLRDFNPRIQINGKGRDVLKGYPVTRVPLPPSTPSTRAPTPISPPAVSGCVTGSCAGNHAGSSSAVAAQMVLEPDMGGYSVCSRFTNPA
jgi:hypothetical protein